MLEQAILDAEELKKAAEKLAEQKIIEKNAEEYKKQISRILEQEDMMSAPSPDSQFGEQPDLSGGEMETEIDKSHNDEKLPISGQEAVSSDDEEKMIELDLSELEQELQNPDFNAPEDGVRLNISQDISDEQDELVNMEDDEEFNLQEFLQELDEDIELEEELDLDLDEELDIDFETVPHGHLGAPTEREYEYSDDMEKAKRTQNQKDKDEYWEEKFQELQEQLNSSEEKIKEYKEFIIQIKENADKLNVLNKKLLYMNKVLGSSSLNERQKKIFKEKLSEAKTVEEAKIVYETLKDTMGVFSKQKKKPESLSEAVSRNNTLLVNSQPEKSQREVINEQMNKRWQQIAGITK